MGQWPPWLLIGHHSAHRTTRRKVGFVTSPLIFHGLTASAHVYSVYTLHQGWMPALHEKARCSPGARDCPRFRGPPAVPDNHGQDLLQERKTMNCVQPPGDKQKNSIPSIRRAVHPLPPPRKTSVFQEELERVLLSAIYRIRFCGIRPKKGGGSVSASSKFLRVAHLSPDGHELCTCGSTCLRPQTDSAWWCGKRPFLRVPGEDRVHP